MKAEEADWRLISHSIWLKEGDRNTKLFHRQAKARIWKNRISELKSQEWASIKRAQSHQNNNQGIF